MPQALNLILSASPVSAEDALTIGLVDEVVPSGELMAAARAAALELAAGSRPRRRTLQLTQHMPVGVGVGAVLGRCCSLSGAGISGGGRNVQNCAGMQTALVQANRGSACNLAKGKFTGQHSNRPCS